MVVGLLKVKWKAFSERKVLSLVICFAGDFATGCSSSKGSFCPTSHESIPLRDFIGLFHSMYFSRTVIAILR